MAVKIQTRQGSSERIFIIGDRSDLKGASVCFELNWIKFKNRTAQQKNKAIMLGNFFIQALFFSSKTKNGDIAQSWIETGFN